MDKNYNEKFEKGFLLIPKDILTLTKVGGDNFSFAEKAVYSYLFHWSESKDSVFPSTVRICKELGIGSRTSLTKYLKKLEEVNLINVVRRKGKSSIYTVLPISQVKTDNPKVDSLIRGTNMDKGVTKEPIPDKIPEGNPFDFQDDPWGGQWDDEDVVPF